MKKLVLFLAVATAVAFASCAPKAEEATEEVVDTTATVVVVEDSATVVEAPAAEAPAAE